MSFGLALGMLGAGALSAASSYAINKANLRNQNEVNDVNINLANTAHQREVADLRLAGLNPILSANGSGAGGTAQVSSQLENPLSGLASSIGAAFSAKQQYNLAQAQTKQSMASADMSVASARQAEIEAKMQEENLKLLKANNEFQLSPEGRRFYRDKQLLEANPKNVSHGLWSILDRAFSDDNNSAKNSQKSYDEKALKAVREYKSVKHSNSPLHNMKYSSSPWVRMQLR